MKFETKIQKLGIDENEVKSIIENCECGEINGAYFIDLTKLRKWEIMETVGNYLDADLLDFDVRFKTFLKTYEITADEIPHYYVLGFNEGGADIAYNLESNPNVILVLTDDERHHNSFVAYAPSQTDEVIVNDDVQDAIDQLTIHKHLTPENYEILRDCRKDTEKELTWIKSVKTYDLRKVCEYIDLSYDKYNARGRHNGASEKKTRTSNGRTRFKRLHRSRIYGKRVLPVRDRRTLLNIFLKYGWLRLY